MFNIILFILSTCFIIPFIAWIIRQQRKSSTNNDDLNHYDNKIMSSVLNETMCPATKIIDRRLSSTLVKTITIKTCVGIYNDQMKQWRPDFYRYATNDGLELTINYVDTLIVNNDDDDNDHFEKTIVAIHGVPGYYTHFDKLVEYYRNTNVRVIVPNLPDFSHTRKTRTFWHTSIEKSTFLKDFLNKLNVKTIDCLICHSFGAQTAAAICENVRLQKQQNNFFLLINSNNFSLVISKLNRLHFYHHNHFGILFVIMKCLKHLNINPNGGIIFYQ